MLVSSPTRAMAVLSPLKITLLNYPSDHPGKVSVPNFPADESKGFHEVPFTKVIYIEKEDFREVSLGSTNSVSQPFLPRDPKCQTVI